MRGSKPLLLDERGQIGTGWKPSILEIAILTVLFILMLVIL